MPSLSAAAPPGANPATARPVVKPRKGFKLRSAAIKTQKVVKPKSVVQQRKAVAVRKDINATRKR